MRTNKTTISDKYLGIDDSAVDVLKILSKEVIDKPEDVDIKTFAWYNGRERGVCLTVHRLGFNKKPVKVITFGEDRHNGEIFVDNWIMKSPPINAPTPNDFPDSAYMKRKRYTAAKEAAEAVKTLVLNFITESN